MKKFVMMFLMLFAVEANAQQRFADLVGPVGVENVKAGPINVAYLTWGGDVATFIANGGINATAKGSIYANSGLNLNLTKGDDFVQQVRDYMGGKTPFLRGTFDQLGQASEVLGSDPRTKPVVFMQLTWSAGDHVVAREGIKNLNDLIKSDKKTRIAVQQGGPHVGFIYAILQAAQGKKEQVEIVWVQDLTGPKGPADAFRKDATIDAACVITPDMLGLTGGLEAKGSGAEGTEKGAHVVVSTQQMSRAIPDVYVVRSDWYKENKETVEKFVAGYLKGCDVLVNLRKQFSESNKLSPEYKNVLLMAQSAFGKDVVPTLEVDGHGLLLDAVFVGLPGQIAFFEDKGNLNGYDKKAKTAVDLAVEWGYAGTRIGFVPGELDYTKIAKLAGIAYEAPKVASAIKAESIDVYPDSNLDERTILTFTISFKANQSDFTADQYGAEFDRAIKSASDFGNAIVVIRGHSDPAKTLVDLVKAGLSKGILQRTGTAGSYKYFFNSHELDLTQTVAVCKLISEGAFDGANPSPRETMQAALNLSQARANAVKKAITEYASSKGSNLDMTQIQPSGVGITEPVIAKPKNASESEQNMRVEFRIVKVKSELLNTSDYGY